MMHMGVIMALFHIMLGVVVFHCAGVGVVVGVVVSICHCSVVMIVVVVLMIHMLMVHSAFFDFLLRPMT